MLCRKHLAWTHKDLSVSHIRATFVAILTNLTAWKFKLNDTVSVSELYLVLKGEDEGDNDEARHGADSQN